MLDMFKAVWYNELTLREGAICMYRVLDLTGVTGGTDFTDLSKREIVQLQKNNVYFELRGLQELIAFTKEQASEVDDNVELISEDDCLEYLEMMNFLVK